MKLSKYTMVLCQETIGHFDTPENHCYRVKAYYERDQWLCAEHSLSPTIKYRQTLTKVQI